MKKSYLSKKDYSTIVKIIDGEFRRSYGPLYEREEHLLNFLKEITEKEVQL